MKRSRVSAKRGILLFQYTQFFALHELSVFVATCSAVFPAALILTLFVGICFFDPSFADVDSSAVLVRAEWAAEGFTAVLTALIEEIGFADIFILLSYHSRNYDVFSNAFNLLTDKTVAHAILRLDRVKFRQNPLYFFANLAYVAVYGAIIHQSAIMVHLADKLTTRKQSSWVGSYGS